MSAHSRTVVLAVTITATISLIVAVLVFFIIYRLRSRKGGKLDRESSFRRELPSDAPRVEFRHRGAALKGLIVEDDGLDVVYLRKVEGGHLSSGCFSKVWYNPMMEEVKRMDCRSEKPSVSEPIQRLPLLHEPRNRQEPETKKASFAERSPPSPPPTPFHQAPLPPPPPPPPLPKRPAPSPPPPPKSRPAPPPQQAKRLIPSNRPPMAPRIQEKGESRTEDSNKEIVQTTKLKPLHWDKVTANADHSMVWNEINDGSFRFDDELMEALFGYKTDRQKSNDKNKKSSNPGSSTAAPSPQIFILDPRKSQNTAIILKSITVSRKEILDSVMEGRGLNAETLEKLTKICPTQDETAKILQFNGNPTKLAVAESFLYHILRAVPSAFVRFNAMLFRANYEPEILHLKESLQICELGCNELRNGGVFFKLLEAILKAGNRLNAGTNRGNAQGFNLTVLRRLSDVKSTDGKTTLLHFVVEQVVRSEGKRCLNVGSALETKEGGREMERECLKLGLAAVESLSSEFCNVKKAAAVDFDNLIGMCSALTTRVDEIKRLLSLGYGGEPGRFAAEMRGFLEGCEEELSVVKEEERRVTELVRRERLTARVDEIKRLLSLGYGGEPGRFAAEMRGFLEGCEEELSVVKEEERRVIELVRKTTVYYQTGVKGGNPLQLFVIIKEFLNNVDRVCAELAKNSQKGRGAPSPPLSPTPSSPVRFQNLQKYFMAQRAGTSSSDSDDDF